MKRAVIKEREGVGVQNEEKVIRDITVNNVISDLTSGQ